MTITRAKLLFVVLMAALLPWVHAAHAQADGSISVGTSVEREKMYVGEPQRMQIDVVGSREVEGPDVSAITDFTVTYRGPMDQSSSMITMFNGKMTQTQTFRYTLLYEITPKRTGRLVIPSLPVRVGGKVYITQPLTVEVVEPITSSETRLEMQLDASSAYVGQPIRLTIRWIFGTNVRSVNRFSMPPLTGCDSMAGPDPRPPGTRPNDERFPQLQIDGDRMYGVFGNALINDQPGRTLTFERILIPREPGQLTIGPARVDYQAVIGERKRTIMDFPGDDRSITERRVSRAPEITIPISALPKQGRPADFSGLVGSYTIFASTDTKQASVGEPIPLRVSVTGPFPLTLVPPLDLTHQGRFPRTEFRLPREPMLGETKGNAMVFEPSIRARTESVSQIPPIELNYFDPTTGKYAKTRSEPLPITIVPSTVVGLGPDDEAADVDEKAKPAGGLAPLDRTPLKLAVTADFPERLDDPTVIGALVGPPLLFACVMAFVTLLRLRRHDPASERQRTALRRCLTALRAAGKQAAQPTADIVARALCGLVADWLGGQSAPGSLTTDEAAAMARGAAGIGAESIASILGRCDAARFAGDAAAVNPTDSFLEQARHAASVFDQAMRRRAETPDSAPIAATSSAATSRTPRAIVTALAFAACLVSYEQVRAAEPAAPPEPITASGSESSWTHAIKSFDAATESLKQGKRAAASQFLVAAEGFEGVAEDQSLAASTRAGAWFNAGNAFFLAGQPARSVLEYRRAQVLNPFIEGLPVNLALARQKVAPTPTPSTPAAPATGLQAQASESMAVREWLLAVPRVVWFRVASVSFGLVWLVVLFLALRGRAKHPGLVVLTAILLVVSAASAAGLVVHIRSSGHSSGAVVLSPATSRVGPDDVIYAAGPTLAPGTEVVVVETRKSGAGQEWVRVQNADQPDGSQSWLPRSSVGLVQDRSVPSSID